MKTKTISWVLTIGLAWELGVGGASDLLRLDYVRMTVEHLGYPLYLLTILGVWKLLATVAPADPRVLAAERVGLRGVLLHVYRSSRFAYCVQ
jgi:DoxX-like family